MRTTGRPSTLRLEPVRGPSLDPIEVTPDGPVEMGRSSQCPVVLEHAGISRRHARVAPQGGRWVINDLGSQNGTFVNTIRLDDGEELALADGDLVDVGTVSMVVRLGSGDDDEVAQTPPPPASPVDRADDTRATRATIFVRLHDDQTMVRELGWRDFSDRYGPIIAGFARNAGLRRQDADDVLQDVMLAFFQAAPGFEYDPSRGRFRGYLKRATLNAVRARWRRERHQPRIAVDDEQIPQAGQLDALWHREWTEHVLRTALLQISPQFEARTFEAFELYGQRDLSAEAVAERLEMSVESVRHAKSRVARALREAIEQVRSAEA